MEMNFKIEKLLDDPNFSYGEELPFAHIFALHCKPGFGKDETCTARRRTGIKRIYDAVFQNGVDAVFFDRFRYHCKDLQEKKRKEASSAKRLQKWKRYPHKTFKKICEDFDENWSVDRAVFFFNGSENIDFFEFMLANGVKEPIHLVSFQNECIFSLYAEEIELVFATKTKYVEFFEKLEKRLIARHLKRMLRAKNDEMFETNVKWKGGRFEFQYCKRNGDVRELAKGEPYQSLMKDSLYFHFDYDDIFLIEHRSYFDKPTTPDGGHVFDYWGINYYTKEQAALILERIKTDKPFESEKLIPWLEKAAFEYNGFYILGI